MDPGEVEQGGREHDADESRPRDPTTDEPIRHTILSPPPVLLWFPTTLQPRWMWPLLFPILDFHYFPFCAGAGWMVGGIEFYNPPPKNSPVIVLLSQKRRPFFFSLICQTSGPRAGIESAAARLKKHNSTEGEVKFGIPFYGFR